MIPGRWSPMWIVVVAVMMAHSGCASSQAPSVADIDVPEQMAGVDADSRAFWKEWTPRQPTSPALSNALEPSTVFDVWHIDDASFQQQVWEPVFHVLNTLKLQIDDEQLSSALQALMFQLEPGVESTSWEIAFLSHRRGKAEGFVLRMAADDGAGVWLETHRRSGSEDHPSHWIFRAEPAVEQSRGLTAWFRADSDHWKTATAFEANADEPTSEWSEDSTLSQLADVWIADLWEPVTGRTYPEPNVEFTDGGDDELGPGWPPALGADIQRRQIEDFVDDTVFPPRLTDEGLKHF